MNEKDEQVLNIILSHEGKENAITSKEIETRLGMRGYRVREAIHRLRLDPSLSQIIASDETGYYTSDDPVEIQGFFNRNYSLAKNTLEMLSATNIKIKKRKEVMDNESSNINN